MVMIDETRVSQNTIEIIGHNYGIPDTGCTFDQYAKRVLGYLKKKTPEPIDNKLVGKLKLCGLRVYLYQQSGGVMTPQAYAEWLGKDLNKAVRTDFANGIENLKEMGEGKNFS